MASHAFRRVVATTWRASVRPLALVAVGVAASGLAQGQCAPATAPHPVAASVRVNAVPSVTAASTQAAPGDVAGGGTDDPTAKPPKVLRKFRRKADNMGPFDKCMTAIMCGGLGGVSKLIMDGLNTTTYFHRDKLLRALIDRPPGQGVVTVSNHVSAVDDPGTIAAMLPGSWLLQPKLVRWTMCATDRCFRNKFVGALLRKGKVMPIERGKGIDQPLMDNVIQKLDEGDWVHMFPEGTRSRDGKLGRMKLGVAKLIAEAKQTPVVVPFFHSGMENILRVGQWIPVNVGQKLTILVGDPLTFDDILAEYQAGGLSRRDMHIAIATRIGDAIRSLRAQMEEIHKQRPELAPYQEPQPETSAGAGEDSK